MCCIKNLVINRYYLQLAEHYQQQYLLLLSKQSTSRAYTDVIHPDILVKAQTFLHQLDKVTAANLSTIEPGLANFIEAKLRMMEEVVTTGTIRRAKLESNHHHQQTNTQLFTDEMPFLLPTNTVKALNGN